MVPAGAKPILMSAPMILALNAELKTQTRRTSGLDDIGRSARVVGYVVDHRGRFAVNFDDPEGDGNYCVPCPYGGPGGVLWVREGVRRATADQIMAAAWFRRPPIATYIADGTLAPCDHWAWKNSALPAIHMPKGMCRFLLNVADVRVERVQLISEADAVAEGMMPDPDGTGRRWPGSLESWSTAANAYRAGWEWLNGKASWDLDPWVWVLSFSVTKR